MGDKRAHERRRRELVDRSPTHFCPTCTSVTYEDDASCLECGSARPECGWTALSLVNSGWLGREIGGRYLLTRRIGQGASGDVYRAESTSIARQFAVKLIELRRSDKVNAEQLEARLGREIEALGRLRNPHIVSFYDAIRVNDGLVALVMDMIEGQTLEQMVDADGPLGLERACRVVRQVANGIHEAHEVGMIHRDLKPENIMIERLPAGDDFVHILDFGIVRSEGDVSVTHGFVGTPLYASPEQAVGAPLDRRSDIYSLGAVLFYALTGRPPFIDDNVYRVLRRHVSEEPPWLSEVTEGREIPRALEDLVHSMLSKRPDDRPETLAAVIEAVDRIARGVPPAVNTRNSNPDNAGIFDRGPSTGVFRAEQNPFSSANKTAEREPLDLSEVSEVVSDAGRKASAADERRSAEMYQSDEWEGAAPKAAILKNRTPTGALKAIQRDQDGEAEPAPWKENSGLFELSGLAEGSEATLCSSTNGRRFAVLERGNEVALGAVDEKTFARLSIDVGAAITAMAFDEPALFTGHHDGTVYRTLADDGGDPAQVHRTDDRKPIAGLGSHGGRLLIGSSSGAVLLASSRDSYARVRRIQSGAPVSAVALNATRDVFAVARVDGPIQTYHLSEPASPRGRFDVDAPVEQMAFSRDGYLLAVLFAGRRLALHHAVTGKCIMRIDQMVKQPLAICFNDDDQLLGFCEIDGRMYGWDLHHSLVPHQTGR